jgi:hypothetical protein
VTDLTEGLTVVVTSRDGSEFIADLTDMAQDVSQEWTEGPSTASFEVVAGEQGASEDLFDTWWNGALMARVEIGFEGRVCWSGYISRMERVAEGMSATISIRDMANAVKAKYKDEWNGKTRYTAWVTNADAQERFGHFERVIEFNGKAKAMLNEDGSIKLRDPEDPSSRYTEVHKAVDAELKYAAGPTLEGVEFDTFDAPSIRFTAVGEATIANTVQVSDGWIADNGDGMTLRSRGEAYPDGFAVGSQTTVGDEILRIVQVCQHNGWLYPLEIEDNDTMTTAGVETPMGAWDRILELAALQNQAGEFYRLAIEPDGGVIYRRMGYEPDYLYLKGAGFAKTDLSLPTWHARPGIVNFGNEHISLPGTHMPLPNLVYMERVTMREGYDMAAVTMRNRTPGDTRRAYETNLQRLKRAKKGKR